MFAFTNKMFSFVIVILLVVVYFFRLREVPLTVFVKMS